MTPAPLPEALGPVLDFLDLAGVAVFALSGALLAAAKRQTIVTFIFFAVVTGVGGGTVRDLLIGAPVFWIRENAILLICIAAALIVWLLPRRWLEGRLLDWLDAAGLAAYASFGAAKGRLYGIIIKSAFGVAIGLVSLITALPYGATAATSAGSLTTTPAAPSLTTGPATTAAP